MPIALVIGLAGLVALAIYAVSRANASLAQESSDAGTAPAADGILSELGTGISQIAGEITSSIAGDPAVDQARTIIQGFERLSLTAYPDPPGQSNTYSIGWGHQITGADGLDQNSVIDRATADSLFASDLARFVDCVRSSVAVDLTPQQEAALISFAYNEGCGAFQNSTLLQLVNDGNFEAAAREFPKWIYASGEKSASLVARRSQEMGVFLS